MIGIEIVSWNVNGIKHLQHKNEIVSAIGIDPGIVCLQEVWRRRDARWFKKLWLFGWWFKSSSFFARLFQRSGLLSLSVTVPRNKRGWTFGVPLRLLLRGSKQDWAGAKGVTLSEYEWGTVANLHLDAGGELADTKARALQTTKLVRILKRHVQPNKALFVVGDFNWSLTRTVDKHAVRDFQKRLNLRIAIREASNGKGIIFYRNAKLSFAVSEPHEGLSNHPRLRARFVV